MEKVGTVDAKPEQKHDIAFFDIWFIEPKY